MGEWGGEGGGGSREMGEWGGEGEEEECEKERDCSLLGGRDKGSRGEVREGEEGR